MNTGFLALVGGTPLLIVMAACATAATAAATATTAAATATAAAATGDTAGAAAAVVPLGETFSLAVGESATIDGEDLVLTFDGVPRDNRCPKDVQCIVAGAATVVLTAESGGAAGRGEGRELTFDVPPGGTAMGPFDGLEITVVKVEPAAISTRRIEAEEYVATLKVERP